MKRPLIPGRAAPKGPRSASCAPASWCATLVDISARRRSTTRPGRGPVTVTSQVNPDMRPPRCLWSRWRGERRGGDRRLNRHAKFVPRAPGRAIELRFTPDLLFRTTRAFSEAARMARCSTTQGAPGHLTPDERPTSWKNED